MQVLQWKHKTAYSNSNKLYIRESRQNLFLKFVRESFLYEELSTQSLDLDYGFLLYFLSFLSFAIQF